MDAHAADELRSALPPGDPEGDWLMVHPAVLVDELTAGSAVVFDPRSQTSLRLTRPVFDLLQRFRRPSALDDALPPAGPRRERALACVRQLRAKGFLAPLSSVLEAAGGWTLSLGPPGDGPAHPCRGAVREHGTCPRARHPASSG